ncbi:MAG TPA: riboflavin synthase [Solirubrobacteraceae bacterium]|nr:riboflavin synthase [Solirubrobacteraceae bacterium]
MFTGLVAYLGTVVAVETGAGGSQLAVVADGLAGELSVGDSISVSGACLTATTVSDSRFVADVVAETLARTTLGELEVGSRVNLELPLRASDRLGGHVVLGHVDGVATVSQLRDDDSVVFEIEPSLARYVVEKGSIALDGVSLTVAAVDECSIVVALIPETRRSTTLGFVKIGSRVNVEVDILAKHVEKLVAA